jgi:hypothetical protein
MSEQQDNAKTVADLLQHAGKTLIANSAQLDEALAANTTLADENDALRHDFSSVSSRNKRLQAENDQLHAYFREDGETIKVLRDQLAAVSNDGARAYALLGNLKREIEEFDQGKDPRERANMRSPDEVFNSFLELGEMIGLDRAKLLASLNTPEPEEEFEEAPAPAPQRKPRLRDRLFGRNRDQGGYVNEMARSEPEAMRPPMMKSVVADAAATAERLEQSREPRS